MLDGRVGTEGGKGVGVGGGAIGAKDCSKGIVSLSVWDIWQWGEA